MFKAPERYIYIVIALILVVIETAIIVKGEWSGDFWEHSAVVNELARHLASPRHPMLDLPLAHAFFSPYSCIVAVFARLTGLDAVMSLQCFAFFNLLLFVSAFWFFCHSLFGANSQRIAGLSLLFILFFWGSSPFLWSGFYHIFVLNYVLPYPSTFAIALSLIALGQLARKRPGLNSATAVVVLLTAIVFLSHPYTGVFLMLAIVAIVLTFYNASFKEAVSCLCLIAIPALLLCAAWPYYNFIQLMIGSNTEFHAISKGLYERPAGIYWPLALSLPAMWFVKRSRATDFLFLALGFMVLLFILGYISGSYGLGRIMSTAMLFGHIIIAHALVSLSAEKIKTPAKVYIAAVLIFFVVAIARNGHGLEKVLDVSKTVKLDYYKRYEFLRNTVPADALILSDLSSSWYIPTFGGKVIASVHPLFLVTDNAERQAAVNDFFNAGTPLLLKEKIIRQYHPDYILVDSTRGNFSDSTAAWLNSIGKVVYQKDSLQLIRLR